MLRVQRSLEHGANVSDDIHEIPQHALEDARSIQLTPRPVVELIHVLLLS